MAAPKGHPLWGNPQKPKKYTPGQLWEKAIEYFEWCDENPIIIIEQTKMPQRLDASMMKTMKLSMIKAFLKQTVEMPHQRCYSIEGLAIFANMNPDTFYEYAKQDTYSETCTRIRHIINTQHLEGGMAGTFNANIVTRKLGLVDKKDMTSDGKQLMPNIVVQDQKTAEEIDKLVNK